MRTCVIETHYHSEYLNTLIHLFPKSDVYLTRPVYDDLPEDSQNLSSTFFISHSNQKIKEFISGIETQNYDLLFVNTIQPSMVDLPYWLNFKPKCKSILTLHNLNAWKNKSFPLRPNLLRSADSFLSGKYTKRVLSNFQFLNVVYEPMVQTATDYFGSDHKILNIPFSFALEKVESEKSKNIRFVIPGTVSDKRRDYTPVLEAFKKLFSEYDNVHLMLLGKNVDGIDIKNSGEKFISFKETVPRESYNYHMKNSDAIIVPSQKTSHTVNMTEEVYGYTKSPNIHEAIKFRKPLLIPDYIPIPKDLLSSTLVYEDSVDLYDKLRYFIENKIQFQERAYKNTQPYTLQNIKKKLEEDLNG